jgi:hypothetical protein
MASKVEAARRLIYDFAKPITGAGVDGLLKEFSGVPTKVSTFLFAPEFEPSLDTYIRIPLLSVLAQALIHPICLWLISCMNLSSECGRLFLHISSVFSMQQGMVLID